MNWRFIPISAYDFVDRSIPEAEMRDLRDLWRSVHGDLDSELVPQEECDSGVERQRAHKDYEKSGSGK